MDNGLPHLGADTLQTRAAQSEAIFEARQRATQEVVDQFDTYDDPREVPIRRRDGQFAPGQDFLDEALPREAAADLDPQFPRQDVGPGDVQQTESGAFAPSEGVRRRSAAFDFEERTALDDVDPFGDLVAQQGGGFGLTQQTQREAAAADLDPQYPNVGIGADDVTPADGGGFGLTEGARREVAAERIEDQTPLDEVAPGEVRETEGGAFELRDSVIEENRSLFR